MSKPAEVGNTIFDITYTNNWAIKIVVAGQFTITDSLRLKTFSTFKNFEM